MRKWTKEFAPFIARRYSLLSISTCGLGESREAVPAKDALERLREEEA